MHKKLATLFMRAVDAAKTGDIINISKFAKIDPGRPHFMQISEDGFSKGEFHSTGSSSCVAVTFWQIFSHTHTFVCQNNFVRGAGQAL